MLVSLPSINIKVVTPVTMTFNWTAYKRHVITSLRHARSLAILVYPSDQESGGPPLSRRTTVTYVTSSSTSFHSGPPERCPKLPSGGRMPKQSRGFPPLIKYNLQQQDLFVTYTPISQSNVCNIHIVNAELIFI